MLLLAWAITRPTSASAKSPHRGCGADAAARRPPISPEVSVIENTHARVMRSQRDTASMRRPAGMLPLAMIFRQVSKKLDASTASPSGGASATTRAESGMRSVYGVVETRSTRARDRHRDAVQDGVAGERIERELVGEDVAVDAGVRARDAQRDAGLIVAPPMWQA